MLYLRKPCQSIVPLLPSALLHCSTGIAARQKIMKRQPLITLAIALLLLSACGDGNTAPDGSTITIDPTSKTWPTGATSPCTYDLSKVAVTVRNSRGRPIPGVDVDLSLSLASGTTGPSTEYVELYSGYVNNQQIASGEATKLLLPTRLSTNDAGVIELSAKMNIGCGLSYRSVLSATSGPASASANFETTSS